MIMLAWDAYCKVHKVISGVHAVRGIDQIATMGFEANGWDFMDILPSPEEIEAADEAKQEEGEDEGNWIEHYMRELQGDPSAVVDKAFVNSLHLEFAEITAVAKAAMPLFECYNKEWYDDNADGMATKMEDRYKEFFDII